MPCAICRSATTGSRFTVSTRSIRAASLSHKASQRSSGALAARACRRSGSPAQSSSPGRRPTPAERQPAQHGAEIERDGAVARGLDLAGHRHGGPQAAGIVAAGGKRFEKRGIAARPVEPVQLQAAADAALGKLDQAGQLVRGQLGGQTAQARCRPRRVVSGARRRPAQRDAMVRRRRPGRWATRRKTRPCGGSSSTLSSAFSPCWFSVVSASSIRQTRRPVVEVR